MMVGVIGLGKLGLPFALTFAQTGASVCVWDHSEEARRAVAIKIPHIDEPQVRSMLEHSNLTMLEPHKIAAVCHVIFIIVPTPSLDDRSFDTTYVEQAIKDLGHYSYGSRVVAVVSTVSPGTCDGVLEPLCDTRGLKLVYSPTLIALGTVVNDLKSPEVQIIGVGRDPLPGHTVATAMRRMAPDAEQRKMSYISAEITKLSGNAFTTMKIAFANVLGQLSDQYGADVDDVTNALGLHRRIGRPGLTAGAGFGGPCFPRDTGAFAAAGAHIGTVIHALNEEHLSYVVTKAMELRGVTRGSPMNFTFTVIGRSYKENTSYRIESFGDKIADRLERHGAVHATSTRDADLVVIAQPLANVNLCDQIREGATVYDLWRTHEYLAKCPVDYHKFGA
jgi:UDPglucose 6-dehydrogenase